MEICVMWQNAYNTDFAGFVLHFVFANILTFDSYNLVTKAKQVNQIKFLIQLHQY